MRHFRGVCTVGAISGHFSLANIERAANMMLLFFCLKTEKKMNSETPPTISMALVNPQMPSVSADGKNSSTQQLSISV